MLALMLVLGLMLRGWNFDWMWGAARLTHTDWGGVQMGVAYEELWTPIPKTPESKPFLKRLWRRLSFRLEYSPRALLQFPRDAPAAVAAALAGALWLADFRARRQRSRVGLCPHCGYPREGLASPEAPCPECGKARE